MCAIGQPRTWLTSPFSKARGGVGRSGVPTQSDGGGAGAGESVGRVPRVGSRGVGGGREGRSVGHPVSRLSGRGGAVVPKFYANFIKKESILFCRCPLESDTTLMQKTKKQEELNLELGAALSSNRIVASRGAGSSWVGRCCRPGSSSPEIRGWVLSLEARGPDRGRRE